MSKIQENETNKMTENVNTASHIGGCYVWDCVKKLKIGGKEMKWIFLVTIIMVSPICYTAIMIEKEYNEFMSRRKK